MESRHPKRRRVASRSWSHLVTDILIDVASKHVTSAATYTTLRGVCRSWRAALPATVPRPHRLPPQLPFLYIFAHSPHNPAGQAFSLTTNRTFALRHLADAHESASVGSGYGWLLLLDPVCNLILRNPFTGDTIRLPSLEGTLALNCKDKPMSQQHFLVHRAILSSDPSADRNFLVVLFSNASLTRCFTWRSGDNFWTVREHPEFFVDDIIFYEDRRCIAVGINGACAVFDFATADGGNGFFTEVPNLPASGSPFLVESAGNVWLATVRSITSRKKPKVEIYRLDLSRLPDEITAVSESGDLGGRILFLKQCNSMSVASMHFPGFEGDSIYFPKINRHSLEDPRNNYTASIWEFQLKNVIVGRSSIEGECRVYTPWPKLWWVPPNLHKKLGE
ncbi:F-box protein At1g10110-like [Ananas comosus]|uniref:F-box protein At1g10110-like n=1 Tax=Ananas comosus TaxID=4615 RepID=A0A6P5EJ16_ANACO|nr:F-box protein At1g10110-like [Ananas comosus]